MKNNNILVTGGCGFIGSNLIRYMKKNVKDQIICLDDLSGGFKENIPKDIKLIHGSINNVDLVKSLFREYNFKYVYHLAAYAAEGLSHFIRRYNYENNLIGSINLINESVNYGVKCFIFTSSIAVYGKNQTPMKESMTPTPEDPYGVAKLAVEQDLKSAQDMFGLNYIIFRPHNVYGEYQNIGDKYRNVVGIFMNQILKNEPLTVFGDGEQQRAFSYIGDIIPIIAESPNNLNARNKIFNIGADTPYTVNELIQHILRVFGKSEHDVKHLPERNEVKIAYSDHAHLKNYFQNENYTNIEIGLNKMAEWVKLNGIKTSKDFGNLDIEKNLPSSWKK
jgi:UDP-glucose 4-epimerase